MYQDSVADPGVFPRRWAQARQALAWSAVLLAVAFVAVCLVWDLLPQASITLLVAVAVSELVLAPVVTLLAFGYAAHGRMEQSAMAPALLSLAGMLILAGEVLVGLALGFVLQLSFAAPTMAAEVISLGCRLNLSESEELRALLAGTDMLASVPDYAACALIDSAS